MQRLRDANKAAENVSEMFDRQQPDRPENESSEPQSSTDTVSDLQPVIEQSSTTSDETDDLDDPDVTTSPILRQNATGVQGAKDQSEAAEHFEAQAIPEQPASSQDAVLSEESLPVGETETGAETNADPLQAEETGGRDGADDALKPGPELQAWHARSTGAAQAIEAPTLTRAGGAAQVIRGHGQRMRRGRVQRRASISQEAGEAVSQAPEVVEVRPDPPPDPVPLANEMVEKTAGKPMPDTVMPNLNPSPRGTQPLAHDPAAHRPEPQSGSDQSRGRTYRLINASRPTTPTTPTPNPQDERTVARVNDLAHAPVVEQPAGTAQGATIKDELPPPRQPLPPDLGNIMRDVIARLLLNTRAQAEPIVTGARNDAYPNMVLSRAFETIGDDRLDGLAETLSEALHLVAADAGIAADQLTAAVDKRRAEVETEADAASCDLEATAGDEADAMRDESSDEVAQVEAAEDAQHARTSATVEAATGEGSPQVIDAKRDAQIRKINRRVANLRFDYDRTKDRRHAALNRARISQQRAYVQTATADQAAIDTESGDRPVEQLSKVLEKANIRNWLEAQKRLLGTRVRDLKTTATNHTEGFRSASSTAGTEAVRKVRDWADGQKKETTSWWERLWARITDWSQQAEVEAQNWSVVRAGEARDATVQNMGVLAGFIRTQGEGINLETNEAFNNLSKEQQAVIRAYYTSPAGSRDTIGAVAAGLRYRLAAQQKQPMIEAMKRDVMNKPYSDASQLEQIGQAQSSGFNATLIADRLHDAMFGGITGWGTDEDKIYNNLTGLTPLQGKAVRATYRNEHGSNLDSDLASELDADNALIRARAALDGDPVMETVGALNEAMAGMGTDEDTIMRVLRGKSAEQRARITEEYRRQYGVDLNAALDSEMDSHDQHRAEALLQGNVSRADAIALDQAMHGGFLGWATDEAQIESVYGDIRNDVAGQQVRDDQGGQRPMTQQEMEAEITQRNQQVEASYNDEYGSASDQESALRAAYRNDLSGPDLDLANALADNNLVAADAAMLERERQGFYADDNTINGILENQYGRSLEAVQRDPVWSERRRALHAQARTEGWNPYRLADAERAMDRRMEDAARAGGRANMAALEGRYDSEYSRWGSGGLQVMIAFNMSGTTQDKARALREQGGFITRAQRIDFATRGVGTDEADFEKAMTGVTAAEIAEINADLARMGRPNVRSLIASELDGRDAQDMGIRAQGVPQNFEQEMDQARQRAEWEMANSPNYGHSYEVLRTRMNRMQQQYNLINDPDADPFERQRARDQFRARGSGIQSGVESYRAQVDAVTDAIATAAALAAAITVTVATGGVAGAVLGALAAAAASMAVKAGMKGAAYGAEDMALDAVIGVVDAAAAYATFGMGNALLRVATSQGGRMSRLGGTRLATTLARLAGSSSRTQRMMAHGVSEMVEGAAGALPSALTGNLLNDKNWEQGNPFMNILSGTLMETGMGSLMGGAMGSIGGFSMPHVDAPTPRSGDILAHRGTPRDRMGAWRNFQVENPEANMRQFLRRYDDQIADRLAAESRDTDIQRALRRELLSGIPARQRGQFSGMKIEVMSDADFKAFTKSDSASAVTLIENGRPRVILRDGAPPSALREEGIHLQQIADPDLGRLARRLDETRLRGWDTLTLGEKLELYAIKLELEIDAQIKLIRGIDADLHRSGSGLDASTLHRQRDIAQNSLTNLRRRADEVTGIGLLDRMAMARGLRDPPPYLDQPARLFQKTKKVANDNAAPAPRVGDTVLDSPFNQHGKGQGSVHLRETPRTETSKFELNDDAIIVLHKGNTTTTLEMRDGQLYIQGSSKPLNRGTKYEGYMVMGGNNTLEPFDFTYNSGRTIHVEQLYRIVELRTPNASGTGFTTTTRAEAFSMSHTTGQRRKWVQRGSESTKAGGSAELASQNVSAGKAADSKSDVVAHFQVQRPNGTGFDGIELRLDAQGRPVITVIEVKNYNRHVPYDDFTAVSANANLLSNIDDMTKRFTPTDAEYDLAHRNIETIEAHKRFEAEEARIRQEAEDIEATLGHSPMGPMGHDTGGFDLDDLYDMMAEGPSAMQMRALEAQADISHARIVAEADLIVARRLGLSPDNLKLARNALDDGRIELLLRLTQTTKIGRQGKNNLFDRLSKDWADMQHDPRFRNVPNKIRVEMISRQGLRRANSAMSGARALSGMDDRLTHSGIADAPFIDGEGRLLDVHTMTQAQTSAPPEAIAKELQARLTQQINLPNGSSKSLHLVVDISDAVKSKPDIETEITNELIRLGMNTEQLKRLAFLRVRV